MVKPFSPVEQDYIWLAEYSDGTYLAEYDFDTKQPNKFYEIKRDRLIRFGLVGHGMRLFYEVFGGTLKLNGQMYQLLYKVGDTEYPLTGQPLMYNNIITYKDAESYARMTKEPGGRFFNRIIQYNFGYKAQLNIKDTNFQFKILCQVPFNSPAYLTIRLVADKDLDGKLVIKRNGLVCAEFQAPLDAEVGGELHWLVN